MEKVLCKTISDMGSVCINGVWFPNQDDGYKKVVLTDEMELTYKAPFIDLRKTDINIYCSDCNLDEEPKIFTQEDIGGWMVEIVSCPVFNTIYLVKNK